MIRSGNAIVLAVSIVCGVALVSLLNGSAPPWFVIVAVLALGVGVSIVRRRHQRPGALSLFPDLPDERSASSPEQQPPSPARQGAAPARSQVGATAAPANPAALDPSGRRAGVRSTSLGTEPDPTDADEPRGGHRSR